MAKKTKDTVSRRKFIGTMGAGGLMLLAPPWGKRLQAEPDPFSPIFHVTRVPGLPFSAGGNRHAGVEALLALMVGRGLMFFRSTAADPLAGPAGMIAADDVVLVKVNAQWKYRGCTNSDVVRGLVQRILEHPDGFRGEVVIVENGQGRGSLNCDTQASYDNPDVHANAVDERHSFLYLVDHVFADPRVSAYLFDPIRAKFIGADDHQTDGYRRFENVSYPCFTSAGGRRVELREGVWDGTRHTQALKLLNVPVLKHHDSGGSEITSALKLMYGMVSMADGNSGFRHYEGLGETCGKMMASVRTPVLNIVDAIWVAHKALSGFPADRTRKLNVLAASQDPVALDYWAAKHILYPVDGNPNHHPDYANIQRWLVAAERTINDRGGLYHPEWGIAVGAVTRDEGRMIVHSALAGPADFLALTSPNGGESWARGSVHDITWSSGGETGSQVKILLLRGGIVKLTLSGAAPLAAGSFRWHIPADLARARDYSIRILSKQYPALRDASDLPFAIGMAPAGTFLAVSAPGGGETWARGSIQDITWSYGGQPGAQVKILLLKAGVVARTIAGAAPAGAEGSGRYSWRLPADLPAGADYRVRVQSLAYTAIRGQSASNFAISR